MVGTSITRHAVWLRRILRDLAHEENEPTTIFCGNNSAIALPNNFVLNRKSKHIGTHWACQLW
jgi:hypothetical protein